MRSKLKFADEKVKDTFYRLKDSTHAERALYGQLSRAFGDIEKDAFCGMQVPKELIPKEYVRKYGIDNLWKYNLPGAWRLLYSVAHDEVTVISVVLEWLSHKDYEKRFKYHKK